MEKRPGFGQGKWGEGKQTRRHGDQPSLKLWLAGAETRGKNGI